MTLILILILVSVVFIIIIWLIHLDALSTRVVMHTFNLDAHKTNIRRDEEQHRKHAQRTNERPSQVRIHIVECAQHATITRVTLHFVRNQCIVAGLLLRLPLEHNSIAIRDTRIDPCINKKFVALSYTRTDKLCLAIALNDTNAMRIRRRLHIRYRRVEHCKSCVATKHSTSTAVIIIGGIAFDDITRMDIGCRAQYCLASLAQETHNAYIGECAQVLHKNRRQTLIAIATYTMQTDCAIFRTN
mmetsp:Transcript_2437/g.4725  ORF Transcript_2437/g.4725 Transcript_2437/m.4725 type:complete len:244 (+) Transcript_2437:57-788(+)